MSTPRNTCLNGGRPFIAAAGFFLTVALASAGCDLRSRWDECDPGDDAPRCDGDAIATCEDAEYAGWSYTSCEAWVCSEASGRAACVPPDPEPLASEGTVDACTHLRPVVQPGLLEIPQPARTPRPVAALPKDESGSALLTFADIAIVSGPTVTADVRPTSALSASHGATLQPHVEPEPTSGVQLVVVNERLSYLVDVRDYEREVELVEVVLCPVGDEITAEFFFEPAGHPGRVEVVISALLDDADAGQSEPVSLYVEP